MRLVSTYAAALVLALVITTGFPNGSARGQEQPIYGSQLMTEQERAEYRARMRAARTEEERQQIRLEHHSQMQERATERGIELPDAPPAMGMGGQGMRPGAGMGSGGARGGGRGG